MIRYLRWAAKHNHKVPRFNSEVVIPKSKGTISDTDLINMYDLRMYHITNYTQSKWGDRYIHELEYLHRELNERMNNKLLFKWGLFAIAFGIFCKIYELDDNENLNWNAKWNLVHQWTVFMELDEGGEEGDEPDGL
jgi:hypothetical protein